MALVRYAWTTFVVLLGTFADLPAAHAQHVDSTRVGVQRPPAPPKATPVRPDTTRPPISPGRAFLYSLALPGLGQARLQRGTSGAVYFTFEAISVAMASKSLYDLRVARDRANDIVIGSYTTGVDDDGNPIPDDTLRNRYAGNRVRVRRTHLEDWIAAMVFNHLFSGADAFVSAHLWDLPVQLGFKAVPAVAILRAASRDD